MKWEDGRRSDNLDDRRGTRLSGGTGIKLGGGAILLVAVVALLLGEDPMRVLGSLAGPETESSAPAGGSAPAPGAPDPQREFVAVILADTEDTWKQVFAERGAAYQEPVLVLFAEAVDSACGMASSAVGPFYCPGDHKVYLDLSFFRDLDERFGAPGDFAQAYVVAHEIGHHVQNLLGVTDDADRKGARLDREGKNAISVQVELMADCLAGVWGHYAAGRRLLEPGDVEEGLAAAAAIGDDRLQREAGRRVSPESWTHGSSEMRGRWFRRGLESGRLESCDTFAAGRP